MIMNGLQLEIHKDPEVVRELTPADLQQPKNSTASKVKKVSQRHHHLARCIASGMSNVEAGAVAGYCPSRISILKADPLFKELVHFYSATKQDVFTDTLEMLKNLTNEAVRELMNRLETEPETLSNDALLKALTIGADRTGFGPTTTQQTLNISLTEQMDLAEKRVNAHLNNEIIDAETT